MINVLFVCLGNICRSPLAEAVFRKQVEEQGLSETIKVDSAGTSDYHIGQPADPRSISTGALFDLEVSSLARQFTSGDFADFTYIIAMDRSNMENIRALQKPGNASGKLFLMREFDDEKTSEDVPDPYFGGEEGFHEVYKMLKRSCSNLLKHIIKENNLL